jgi:hypothetical protein
MILLRRRKLITGAAALAAYVALDRPARATSWLLIASNKGSGQNSPATPPMNMTGANLIVISASYTSGAMPTLVDSISNSYTNISTVTNSSSFKTGFWYVRAPTVTSAMTFTLSGSNVYGYIIVQGWGGTAASPPDQSNSSVTWTGGNISPGPVTPGQANELVVTCLGANDGGTTSYTIGGAFTIPSNNSVQQTGSNYGGSMAYFIETSAVATNPQWTDPATINGLSAAIASFKQTGASATQGNAHFFRVVP